MRATELRSKWNALGILSRAEDLAESGVGRAILRHASTYLKYPQEYVKLYGGRRPEWDRLVEMEQNPEGFRRAS